MSDSPAAILFDENGNPVIVVNGALKTVSSSNDGIITVVSVATSDTLLLDSNSNRRGAVIYNDTTSAKLKIGLSSSTVSNNNFSVLIDAGGLFDIPFGYTGQIRGIWSVDEPSGVCRITELI